MCALGSEESREVIRFVELPQRRRHRLEPMRLDLESLEDIRELLAIA